MISLALIALLGCKDKDIADTVDTSAATDDTAPTTDIDDTGEDTDPVGDDTASDDTAPTGDDTGLPEDSFPGVLRVGPPAAAVGIYGIAADPGSGRVFVSSLHVPFITVIDAATGAWSDALDMRPFGIDAPHFPRLYVVGDELWGTHLIGGLLFRFDLTTGEPLDTVLLPSLSVGTAGTDEGVWVALSDGRVVRYEGTAIVEELAPPIRVERLAVEGDLVAVLDVRNSEVALVHRTDGTLWSMVVDDASLLEGVALMDGRVFVTERERGEVIALEDGAEVGRVHTGSDTFSVTRDGDQLLVANRQGEALPASGAYEGAPGTVVAIDRELNVLWTSEHDKTIHFLAYDGAKWWAANEDSLNMSALDPATGEVVVRGPRVGLTVDHLAEYDGAYFFGSHLTDELWRVDFEAAEAVSADVCGWPFVTVFDRDRAMVPCQEAGDVAILDPATMTVTETLDLADTFHADCGEDKLCTGHSRLLDAALDGDRLAFTDPYTLSVRWEDNTSVAIEPDGDERGVLHMGLVAVEGGLLSYESSERSVRRIADGAIVGAVAIPGDTFDFPLVPDGDRTWVSDIALNADLSEAARLPVGVAGAAAGAGWVVGVQGSTFIVYDHETLTETSRLSMSELRSPPYVVEEDDHGPLRLMVDEVGPSGRAELIVANLFRGTIERRLLPSLAATGTDEVVPVGHWADLDGLR